MKRNTATTPNTRTANSIHLDELHALMPMYSVVGTVIAKMTNSALYLFRLFSTSGWSAMSVRRVHELPDEVQHVRRDGEADPEEQAEQEVLDRLVHAGLIFWSQAHRSPPCGSW